MSDIDQWDGLKRVRDRSFNREDLEHWMKGAIYLSITKFQYVDRWIRLNRNSDPLCEVIHDLIIYKELSHRRTFSELYSMNYNQELNDAEKALSKLEGNIFVSEILEAPLASQRDDMSRLFELTDFRQIILYFRERGQKSISVTALYLDTPLSELRPNPDKAEWVPCFGYLTIIGMEEWSGDISAVLTLFRSKFPGNEKAGNSVSSTSLHSGGYDRITTRWQNQICSQNLTGDNQFQSPKLSYEDAVIRNAGACSFENLIKVGPEVEQYVKSLQNRYLIW